MTASRGGVECAAIYALDAKNTPRVPLTSERYTLLTNSGDDPLSDHWDI